MIQTRIINQTVITDGGAALSHILDLAGPELGPKLIAQMVADLQTVQAGLGAALSQLDWVQLRVHSHVLISLAGTMGATGLQGMAVLLNECAHDQKGDHVRRIMPQVDASVAALIDMLQIWQRQV